MAHRGRRRTRLTGARRPTSPASPTSAASASRYEVFGQGEETLLLLPPWAIVHSRFWKAQVPVPRPPLPRRSRSTRAATARSDRPDTADAYGPRMRRRRRDRRARRHRHRRAACSSRTARSRGAALLLAADHAERVAARVFMSPALPITPAAARAHRLPPSTPSCDALRGLGEGATATTGRSDFRGYLEFFFGRVLAGAALDEADRGLDRLGRSRPTPETLAHTIAAPDLDATTVLELLGRIRCPLLVTQGDEDQLIPPDRGAAFAELTGAELVELEGVGHCPHGPPSGARST